MAQAFDNVHYVGGLNSIGEEILLPCVVVAVHDDGTCDLFDYTNAKLLVNVNDNSKLEKTPRNREHAIYSFIPLDLPATPANIAGRANTTDFMNNAVVLTIAQQEQLASANIPASAEQVDGLTSLSAQQIAVLGFDRNYSNYNPNNPNYNPNNPNYNPNNPNYPNNPNNPNYSPNNTDYSNNPNYPNNINNPNDVSNNDALTVDQQTILVDAGVPANDNQVKGVQSLSTKQSRILKDAGQPVQPLN